MVPAARKSAITRESFAKASSKVLTSAAVNAKVVSQSEDREGARSRNSARPAWSCRRGDRLKRRLPRLARLRQRTLKRSAYGGRPEVVCARSKPRFWTKADIGRGC